MRNNKKSSILLDEMNALVRLVTKLWNKGKKAKDKIPDPENEAAHNSEWLDGEYDVPPNVREKQGGLYAIQFAQGEMYDLGSFDFIPRFILYDRGSKIALDVTNDIKPAPLLSRTQSACVISEERIRDLEAYLIGDQRPKYRMVIESGMRYFKAQELGEEYATLSQRMQDIVNARKAVDQSVENLRTEVMALRGRYISE